MLLSKECLNLYEKQKQKFAKWQDQAFHGWVDDYLLIHKKQYCAEAQDDVIYRDTYLSDAFAGYSFCYECYEEATIAIDWSVHAHHYLEIFANTLTYTESSKPEKVLTSLEFFCYEILSSHVQNTWSVLEFTEGEDENWVSFLRSEIAHAWLSFTQPQLPAQYRAVDSKYAYVKLESFQNASASFTEEGFPRSVELRQTRDKQMLCYGLLTDVLSIEGAIKNIIPDFTCSKKTETEELILAFMSDQVSPLDALNSALALI